MTSAATYLSQAQGALHKLLTGQTVVTVRKPDGGQVTFKQADVGELRAYIGELKVQTGESVLGRRNAIGVRFS